MKNELCDYLSPGSFNDLLGRDTEELAKEAFAKMDVQLDLFAKATPSKSTEWKVTDLLPEYMTEESNGHVRRVTCTEKK